MTSSDAAKSSEVLLQALTAIEKAGGRPLYVGGCVRDQLFGTECKDIDIEVYLLTYEQLVDVLANYGKVATVGRSFGVIKLWSNGEEYDFSLPRRDSKVASGHKGFVVEADHTLTPAEAAARRDYTINSMAKTSAGELIDPFNGEQDLQARILRATSPCFVEDPLRVLRGMQFAARFEMRVEKDTATMCQQLKAEFDTLAVERIWVEFEKLCSKGRKPGLGIQFLIDTGWLELFPQLHDMHNSPQDPQWHPEGCVLSHTMHCVNAAADIAERENISGEDRTVLILALLCHDIGKPATSTKNDAGRYTNPAHAEKGVPIAKAFLQSIGAHARIIDRVLPLVKYHMVHLSLQEGSIAPRFVRRLARNLGAATINELAMVMEADKSGRPPLAKGIDARTVGIVEVAKELALEFDAPVPLVQGRHLIQHFAVRGGPAFQPVLDAAFEAQLNGAFDNVDDGLDYIKKHRLADDLTNSKPAN